MRQFMDEVSFRAGERGGTRIELIKRSGYKEGDMKSQDS